MKYDLHEEGEWEAEITCFGDTEAGPKYPNARYLYIEVKLSNGRERTVPLGLHNLPMRASGQPDLRNQITMTKVKSLFAAAGLDNSAFETDLPGKKIRVKAEKKTSMAAGLEFFDYSFSPAAAAAAMPSPPWDGALDASDSLGSPPAVVEEECAECDGNGTGAYPPRWLSETCRGCDGSGLAKDAAASSGGRVGYVPSKPYILDIRNNPSFQPGKIIQLEISYTDVLGITRSIRSAVQTTQDLDDLRSIADAYMEGHMRSPSIFAHLRRNAGIRCKFVFQNGNTYHFEVS